MIQDRSARERAQRVPTANDLIALPLVVLAALGAAVIARQCCRFAWPRALWLVPVALAAWAVMVHEGMIGNYARWLRFEMSPSTLVTLGAATLGVIALSVALRRRGSHLAVAWVAGSVLFIAAVSLTVSPFEPLRLNGLNALGSCVGGADRWVPTAGSDLLTDVLPNAALFAPLGYGLTALNFRLRSVVFTAAVLSVGIELYQAFLTDRVCAPRDLFADVLGACAGAAVLALLCRNARSLDSSHRTSSEPRSSAADAAPDPARAR